MLADRMKIIKPSGTIAIAEKARELEQKGKDIIHLDVGEPDFDTPRHIKDAAVKAIVSGFTKYTSSRGIKELRESISKDLGRRGVNADPEREIVVTPGAKHAIYSACLATLNPNDEVLVLCPTWTTHFQCVNVAQARAIEIDCGPKFSLDEEEIKSKISNRTRMILLCSPNNPTGGVLNEDEIKLIVDLSADNDLLILSDEVYDRILYDGIELRSASSFTEVRERCIVVNGFSKTYAMTGWRIGYCYANKDIVKAVVNIQQSTTTCPSSFVQKASITALEGPQISVETMIKEYDKRRHLLFRELTTLGLKCEMPKGAFYVFPSISDYGMSSSVFSQRLLEEKGVSTTPGNVFGECGEGYIRLSYATSPKTLLKAFVRIKEFLRD